MRLVVVVVGALLSSNAFAFKTHPAEIVAMLKIGVHHWPMIYNVKERAIKVSNEACDLEIRHYGGQSDALRHFILSSLLTANLDEKRARYLLTAHENKNYYPQTKSYVYDEHNVMDLYNNEIGIEFGSSYYPEQLTNDFLVEVGREKLENQEFKIIRPGYTNCLI